MKNKDFTEEGWIGIADSTNPYTWLLRHNSHLFYQREIEKLKERRRIERELIR